MKFKNYKNKLERPFIIYCDCEATLQKMNKMIGKKEQTELINKHLVNSCCYYFVCTFDSLRNLNKCFGKNCVHKMLKELRKIAKDCVAELKKNAAGSDE